MGNHWPPRKSLSNQAFSLSRYTASRDILCDNFGRAALVSLAHLCLTPKPLTPCPTDRLPKSTTARCTPSIWHAAQRRTDRRPPLRGPRTVATDPLSSTCLHELRDFARHRTRRWNRRLSKWHACVPSAACATTASSRSRMWPGAHRLRLVPCGGQVRPGGHLQGAGECGQPVAPGQARQKGGQAGTLAIAAQSIEPG